MSILKQTPTQKLKNEIAKLKQELFEVCTNPESEKAKSIVLNYKMLKAYSQNNTSFYDYLKEMGLGRPSNNPFTHFEASKVKDK